MTNTRLKVPLPTRLRHLTLLNATVLEILQIGDAKSASNRLQVKTDIIRHFLGHGAQEIAAQLLARGAAQPVSPPDFPQSVDTSLAHSRNLNQPLPQRVLATQILLDGRH